MPKTPPIDNNDESFSVREGLIPVRQMQINSMNKALRQGLWNALYIHIWDYFCTDGKLVSSFQIGKALSFIWDRFFEMELDEMPIVWPFYRTAAKEKFYYIEWYKVYELLEYIANVVGQINLSQSRRFTDHCNIVLRDENSAYTFERGKLIARFSNIEMKEIVTAKSHPYEGIKTHISSALDLMSNIENPDYRNSIKESISAVESITRIISDKPKATLADALNMIEEKLGLHGALKKGFQNIYGYTSDEDGVRHAIMEETNLTFDDAKYMLVSCSAFVNYLIAKAQAASAKK
jgi:hypothetical protein